MPKPIKFTSSKSRWTEKKRYSARPHSSIHREGRRKNKWNSKYLSPHAVRLTRTEFAESKVAQTHSEKRPSIKWIDELANLPDPIQKERKKTRTQHHISRYITIHSRSQQKKKQNKKNEKKIIINTQSHSNNNVNSRKKWEPNETKQKKGGKNDEAECKAEIQSFVYDLSVPPAPEPQLNATL